MTCELDSYIIPYHDQYSSVITIISTLSAAGFNTVYVVSETRQPQLSWTTNTLCVSPQNDPVRVEDIAGRDGTCRQSEASVGRNIYAEYLGASQTHQGLKGTRCEKGSFFPTSTTLYDALSFCEYLFIY